MEHFALPSICSSRVVSQSFLGTRRALGPCNSLGSPHAFLTPANKLEQKFILEKMAHKAKNSFADVQAIASHSLRSNGYCDSIDVR